MFKIGLAIYIAAASSTTICIDHDLYIFIVNRALGYGSDY